MALILQQGLYPTCRAILEVSFGDVSGQTVNVIEEWGYITVVRTSNYDVLEEEIYADWEMFAIAYGLV